MVQRHLLHVLGVLILALAAAAPASARAKNDALFAAIQCAGANPWATPVSRVRYATRLADGVLCSRRHVSALGRVTAAGVHSMDLDVQGIHVRLDLNAPYVQCLKGRRFKACRARKGMGVLALGYEPSGLDHAEDMPSLHVNRMLLDPRARVRQVAATESWRTGGYVLATDGAAGTITVELLHTDLPDYDLGQPVTLRVDASTTVLSGRQAGLAGVRVGDRVAASVLRTSVASPVDVDQVLPAATVVDLGMLDARDTLDDVGYRIYGTMTSNAGFIALHVDAVHGDSHGLWNPGEVNDISSDDRTAFMVPDRNGNGRGDINDLVDGDRVELFAFHRLRGLRLVEPAAGSGQSGLGADWQLPAELGGPVTSGNGTGPPPPPPPS
jgi:hypothetical protein